MKCHFQNLLIQVIVTILVGLICNCFFINNNSLIGVQPSIIEYSELLLISKKGCVIMKMIAAIITFIIFIIFAFNLNSSWVYKFDQWGINTFKGNDFFEPFHYIGEPLFVVIVAIIILLVLWFKKQNFRAMLFVLITIAGGNIINLLAKNIVKRERPNIPDQLTSYSFPSGHSMTGILYLLTIAYLLTEFRSKGQKAIAFVFALALTVCVGLSRVAGMRHYLSDVVSGWSLGFTVFVIAVYWYESRKRNFQGLK